MSESASVSVIIPCYRCTDTIERAVASVAAQSLRPAEFILVEDCSGDGTLDVLRALRDRHPEGWIKVVELDKNGGPGTARNAGWEVATQDYIAFLDADDAWHPQKIEIQYSWMVAHPACALSGHACPGVKDQDGTKSPVHYNSDEIRFLTVTPRQLLISNRFSTPTVMVRRNLPHRFVSKKRHSEDFLLWCEICLDGHSCAQSQAELAFLFKAEYGEGGLSGDLWKMEKGELDTYWRLRQTTRIGFVGFTALIIWSMARYIRRLIITGVKKGAQH